MGRLRIPSYAFHEQGILPAEGPPSAWGLPFQGMEGPDPSRHRAWITLRFSEKVRVACGFALPIRDGTRSGFKSPATRCTPGDGRRFAF